MFPTVCLLHPVTSEYVAGKRVRGLCRTWKCRRPKRADRDRCGTCDNRLYRYNHPDYYAFVALKSSARGRGKKFELTFEEFKQFCAETGYLEKKGNQPHSLTVDRIDRTGPYSLANIRIMSHADNSSHKYEEKSDPSAPADF